jgi:hypothetical protein
MRLSIVAAFLLAQGAWASTIVTSLAGGTSGSEEGIQVVSWTETDSFTDVTIGANIAVDNGNPSEEATGTAYLMMKIGAGTTTAEEIASAPVSVKGNPGVDNMTTIFSGLSLGPGTYYLVIDPTSVNLISSLDWDAAGTPTETFGAGASDVMAFTATTTNAAFAPANTFGSNQLTPIFSVTGDLGVTTSPTPEPSTTIFLACGLGVLAVAHRFVKRRSRS